MNDKNRVPPVPDFGHFQEGRCNFPLEELARYAGQYVAWNPEGTRILASGESRDAVDERLAAMGIHFSQVVHDYIDEL